MKTVGIIQPSFIPWKGYFHVIKRCDIFVFLDDVQYTNRDWRNRNKIKALDGTQWLSVPTHSISHKSIINKTIINYSINWQRKMMHAIYRNYSKAPFFNDYVNIIEGLLFGKSYKTISDLDTETTIALARELGIYGTEFLLSSNLRCPGKKSEKILNVCLHLGADCYISGPSGLNYLSLKDFKKHDIDVIIHNYDYPEYAQLYSNFVHEVSIIDMLFNLGRSAPNYIWNQ